MCPLRIAYYDSPQETQAISVDTDWAGLEQLLSRYTPHACSLGTIGAKGIVDAPCQLKTTGAAWSPVDMEDGARRSAANVRAVTALVLDLDHLPSTEVQRVSDRLISLGNKSIIHSTHSHHAKGSEDNCFRLVFQISRNITPVEWPKFRSNAIQFLGLPVDPATHDISRLYFLPAGPDAAGFVFESTDGKSLDVEALLHVSTPGVAAEKPTDAAHVGPVLPAATPSPSYPRPVIEGDARPVDLADARQRLKSLRKPKSVTIARRIVAGDSLGPVGGQDNTLRDMVGVLTWALPDLPDEALLELLRPTLAATNWLDGQEHLQKEALKKIARSRERLRQKEEHDKAIAEKLGGFREEKPRETPSSPTNDPESPALAPDNDQEWHKELKTIEDAAGAVRLRQLVSNAHTILHHAPEWKGTFRFNEVAKRIEMVGGPLPANTAPSFYGVAVAQWLALNYDLHIASRTISELIAAEAREHSYDPLRDYLLDLKWDGKPRLDTMCVDYFRSPLANESGEDMRGYLRAVGSKWMIGAATRGLRPGAAMQTILVLEGEQGCGKSHSVEILGGAFTCALPGTVGDKDSMMVLSSHWVIEIEELSALRGSDAAANKRFISKGVDTFRPPYGAIMEEFPRRCAFIGTCNTDDYLTDHTGNRRYAPVRCGIIDTGALKRDREQLWAEAVARAQAGESCELTEAENVEAKREAAERMPDNPRAARIAEWWFAMAPKGRPLSVTTHDIAKDALQDQHITRALETEIGFMLRDLGFDKERTMIQGVRLYRYIPSDQWLSAPQERSARGSVVIPDPVPPTAKR